MPASVMPVSARFSLWGGVTHHIDEGGRRLLSELLPVSYIRHGQGESRDFMAVRGRLLVAGLNPYNSSGTRETLFLTAPLTLRVLAFSWLMVPDAR